MAVGGGRGRGSSGGSVGADRDRSGGYRGADRGGKGGGKKAERKIDITSVAPNPGDFGQNKQRGFGAIAEQAASGKLSNVSPVTGKERTPRDLGRAKYGKGDKPDAMLEQVPRYPLGLKYGLAQFVGTLPAGPLSLPNAIAGGFGYGLADQMGLEKGPQVGVSNTQTRSNTGADTGLGGGGIDTGSRKETAEEERKKKAAAAKATLLGGISAPLGTEANPQIIT